MARLGLWHRDRAHVSTDTALWRLIKNTPNIRTILDIPSGEGRFARRLADAGHVTTAADIRDVGEIAGCAVARADMNRELPWPDATFDAVLTVEGIEHIERTFEFVRECYRVTRPGGALFLTTPNISSLRSRARFLMTGFHNKAKVPLDETAHSPWQHINMLSFPELRYMLHRAGYVIDAIATNRVRGSSFLYAPLVPLAYIATRWVFARQQRSAEEKRINEAILPQLFSAPILFGEVTIIRAIKRGQGTPLPAPQ